jgi:[methyl-Co(III) methanol-specific corrinoid protein]:coenzyme M methyltransferase
MEQLGVFFPEAHRDPSKMAQLALGATKIVGFDFVRVPFCQTIEAEVLGCGLLWGGIDAVPSIKTHAYQIGDPIAVPDRVLEKGRIPVVVESVGILRKEVGENIAICGAVVGPFSIVGQLVGMDNLMIESFVNPDGLYQFMEVAVKVAVTSANAQIEAGADFICIEDMSASSDLISPDIYGKVVLPFQKILIERLKAPAVLHICGNATPIIEKMAESGACGLSIEVKTDLVLAKEAVGDRVSLIGAVEPVDALLQGTPEVVFSKSRQVLQNGIDILAPGCSIPPRAPLGNLKAMVNAREGFEVKRRPTISRAKVADRDTILRRYDIATQKEKMSVSVQVSQEKFPELSEAIISGNSERTQEVVNRLLSSEEPLVIIEQGLVKGMMKVGDLWNDGYLFLPQVILAADSVQAGVRLCEARLTSGTRKKGLVVMHVAEGDIHTIGKNIVKSLLTANGFEIIDLGTDVPTGEVVEAVKKYKPHLLIGDALMTTTMTAFPKIAHQFEKAGIEIPFACGGGALNREFCESFPFGIYGGKANRAPAIAYAAAEGVPWKEMRKRFHK